jgi:spore photoproduct lyase
MGSLRFAPPLKKVVQERFPKSRLMSAELFPGADGKMRYFKPLRTEMYTKMLNWMGPYVANLPLYLCMESQEIWRHVFGTAPTCNAALEQLIQHGEQARRPPRLIPLSSLTRSLQ